MKPAVKSVPVSVVARANGYVLRRGNDDLLTPKGSVTDAPTQKLAEALAGEWNGQEGKVNLALMPLSQLAMTALDIVSKDRSSAVEAIAAYATTELLCHRAEHPPELAALQEKIWQPHLDWCAERFHAPLKKAVGVMPIKQPAASLIALRKELEKLDAFYLTGLRQVVEVSGSLILGLAMIEERIDAGAVFDAAELDTDFQLEKWGEDPAIVARRNSIRRDLAACERWFSLLKA